MFLAPREYLSFTYFSLQFIQKKKKKSEYRSMLNEEHQQDKLSLDSWN